MQRKQMHAARLSPAASDRLSRIDRIYTLATEVLGSGEKVAQWLKRPSRALAKELNCARSSTASSTDAVVMEVVPGPTRTGSGWHRRHVCGWPLAFAGRSGGVFRRVGGYYGTGTVGAYRSRFVARRQSGWPSSILPDRLRNPTSRSTAGFRRIGSGMRTLHAASAHAGGRAGQRACWRCRLQFCRKNPIL